MAARPAPKPAASTPAGRAAVVMLHGSGDSGRGLQRYLQVVDGGRLLRNLAARGVATYFPDSALRSYQLAGGRRMSVWYDRTGLPPNSPEATGSVEDSVSHLLEVIAEVRASGVPPRRIVLGGFSMGGGIALQLMLRHPEAVGAVFALSSYMCDDARAYDIARQSESITWPPTFMAHGEADDFIQIRWGRATFERLQSIGVPARFLSLPRARHELVGDELHSLGDWLDDVLDLEELSAQ